MEEYPVMIKEREFVFMPAVCTKADVGMEYDGRFLGVSLCIEGDGWGTAGPGMCLDTFSKKLDKRVGTAYGCEFIRNVLEAMGVENFRDINRRPVDVLYEKGNTWGRTMKGFRCRKMHGGSGEWMVFADVIDPDTGLPLPKEEKK